MFLGSTLTPFTYQRACKEFQLKNLMGVRQQAAYDPRGSIEVTQTCLGYLEKIKLEKKRAKVTQIKDATITSILLCKSNVIFIFNIDCINICVF